MDVIFYIKETPFVFSWFVKFHYEVYHCRCERRWSCPRQNAICQLLPFGIAGQPFNQMFCSMPNIQSNMLSPKFPLGKYHHISAICVHFNLQPTRRKKKMLFFELGSVIWKLRWVPVIKSQGCLKNPIKKKKIVLKTN